MRWIFLSSPNLTLTGPNRKSLSFRKCKKIQIKNSSAVILCSTMEPDYFITDCGLPNILLSSSKSRATTPTTFKSKVMSTTTKKTESTNCRSSTTSEASNKNTASTQSSQGMSKAYKNLQNEMIKQKLAHTSNCCNKTSVASDAGRLQSSGDS